MMSPALTPVTAGTVTASVLHTTPSTALGSLLGLSSAIGYQYIMAGGGGASSWRLRTSSALSPRLRRLRWVWAPQIARQGFIILEGTNSNWLPL